MAPVGEACHILCLDYETLRRTQRKGLVQETNSTYESQERPNKPKLSTTNLAFEDHPSIRVKEIDKLLIDSPMSKNRAEIC